MIRTDLAKHDNFLLAIGMVRTIWVCLGYKLDFSIVSMLHIALVRVNENHEGMHHFCTPLTGSSHVGTFRAGLTIPVAACFGSPPFLEGRDIMRYQRTT